MITEKEIRFVKMVSHGVTKSQAYIDVYKPDTNNMNSIRTMSSVMWKAKGLQEIYDRTIVERTKEIVVPTEVVLDRLYDHLDWLKENMCPQLATEYRKTLEFASKFNRNNNNYINNNYINDEKKEIELKLIK